MIPNSRFQVTRYAKPVMHAEKNLVDVNYDVLIIDKKQQWQEKFAKRII